MLPQSAGETPRAIFEPEEFLLTEEDLPRLDAQRKHATAGLQTILAKDMKILQALPPMFERPKSHWDYLLDEVQWMSIDFRQELRWKTQLSAAVADVVKEKVQARVGLPMHELQEAESRVTQIMTAYDAKKQTSDVESTSNITGAEVTMATQDINIITERILALSVVNTYTTAAVPPLVAPFLFKHQIALFNEITRRRTQSLGTIVYGPSFSGKTATVAAMTLQWLRDDAINASEHHQQPRRPCAILVGNRKLLLRWMLTYIRSFRDTCAVLLYHEHSCVNDLQSTLTTSQLPVVILVPIDDDLATVRKIVLQQDMISVCGTVADLRSTALVDKRSEDKHAELVAQLSSFVMGENRMMVADEHIRNIDRLSAIALLVPSLSYAALETRFFPPPAATAVEETAREIAVGESVGEMLDVKTEAVPTADKVNRNTISQMLHNLSVFATIPADSSAIANAQVREEIIAFDLLPIQLKKYEALCQCLLSKEECYDGSDAVMLAKVIAMMKLTCFHSDLVSDDLTSVTAAEDSEKRVTTGQLMQHLRTASTSLPNDCFDQSTKLKALKVQLQRFDNLRRVIVASSWPELCLIHAYLQREKIPHLAPHLALQHGAKDGSKKHEFASEDIDQLLWFEEEMNTQELNRCLSCVMLTIGNVFRTPSSSPWLAEAVIMLGYDWNEYMDIRTCFRMRLIEFRPSDPPVSVVRICAKGTLEEVMIKQKLGIPSLQGMKLGELNIIPKVVVGSKSDKRNEEEVKTFAQNIFLLNAPILHAHSKRAANVTMPLGSPRKNTFTGSGSSSMDSDSQNNSESDSHSLFTTRRGVSSSSAKATPRGSSGRGQFLGGVGAVVSSREAVVRWLEAFRSSYHSTVHGISPSTTSTTHMQVDNEDEEFAAELQELLSDSQQQMTSSELFHAATEDIIMTIFSQMKSRALLTSSNDEEHHTAVGDAQWSLVSVVEGMQAACTNALSKQEQSLFNSSLTPLQRIRMKQNGYGMSAKERRLQAFFLPNLAEALQAEHAAAIGVRPSSAASTATAPTVVADVANNSAAAVAAQSQGQVQAQQLAQQQQAQLAQVVSGSGGQRPAVYQQFRDSIHEMMRHTHTANTVVDPWLYTSPLYSATRQDVTSNMNTMHMVEVINDHRMQIVYKEKPVPPPAPVVPILLAPVVPVADVVATTIAAATSKSKKRKHSAASAAVPATTGDNMPPPATTTSKSSKKQKTEGGGASRNRNSSSSGATSNIIPASLLHPPKVQYQPASSVFPIPGTAPNAGADRGGEGGTEMDLDVDEFGFEDLHADTAVTNTHTSTTSHYHHAAVGAGAMHHQSIVNASGGAQIGSAFVPPLASRPMPNSSSSYDQTMHSVAPHSRYYVDPQNQRYTSAIGMQQQQQHMGMLHHPQQHLQQHHQLPAHRLPLGMTATQQSHGTYMLPQQTLQGIGGHHPQVVRYVQSTPG